MEESKKKLFGDMKKKIKIKLTLPHHKTHSRMTEMAWNEEEKKLKIERGGWG